MPCDKIRKGDRKKNPNRLASGFFRDKLCHFPECDLIASEYIAFSSGTIIGSQNNAMSQIADVYHIEGAV